MLALCPSFFHAAEESPAPNIYADITEEGRSGALEAVERFPWTSATLARRAATCARMLDLLPRERSVPGWSLLVCDLWALMLEDVNPAFQRVRRGYFATHSDIFSVMPLRGPFGWRRRARFAGLRIKR